LTLIEFLQFRLNESGIDAKVTAEQISVYLDRHRYLDPVTTYQAFKYALDSETTQLNTDTGQVTVTLRDLYGTGQYFAGVPGVYLHPLGCKVEVNGEELDSGEYTFNAAEFTLELNAPISNQEAVQVTGHLVNIDGPYGVMYDCIGVLVGYVSKLANVRGQEFKNLRRNLKAWQREFASGVVNVRR